MPILEYLIILAVGLVAGTISGIAGFGSSIMLMPVLVIAFGPREAVPVMAVAALMANASRIVVWWREVDWRVTLAYSVTGIPAAALGARTLLTLPPRIVEAALGIFFLAMIPARRALLARNIRLKLWHMAVVGLGIGYLTGIVVSTGPINTPFFLAYGLTKGAYIATEAAGSLATYVTKALVFRSFGALPAPAIFKGLIVGSSLMVGSLVAKRYVLRLDHEQFRLLMDGLLVVAGITMLWAACA